MEVKYRWIDAKTEEAFHGTLKLFAEQRQMAKTPEELRNIQRTQWPGMKELANIYQMCCMPEYLVSASELAALKEAQERST